MAGPIAGIILPDLMNDEIKLDIHNDIQRIATEVNGDDFWIQDRPFILTLGPEYEGELENYFAEGVPNIIGWPPRDTIGFAAMCKDKQDHRLLGETCLFFARKLGGLIDFGGALTPPIRGKVESLFQEHYFGSGNDWVEWESYFISMRRGLSGSLYSVPFVAANGCNWVYHLGDAEFMESWLQHPHFHMIK